MSIVDKLRQQAESGDAEAQVELGKFYRFENLQNLTNAFNWFRKAAEQGNAAGQYSLGVCYQNGDGTTKDLNEAFNWFRKAAEQGNAAGQCNLGVCYHFGEGVKKDLNEAAKWYRMAAAQGNAWGQFSLGFCQENGGGVEKDLKEASKWYQIVADESRNLELLRWRGSKEAFNFLSQFAHQGNEKMQIFIARCYHMGGGGISHDLTEAVKWYSKAAEQGNQHALWQIESLTKRGSKEAFSFIAHLAQQGNEKMQIFAAECCKNGWGVTKDINEAIKWYRVAAEKGNEDALKSIFELATRGAKEAMDVLLALAQQTHIQAQNMVGWCFEKGKGANRDINEAIKWYRKAADQGDQKASWNLECCIHNRNKDSFSFISTSTAAELSFKEASPLLPIESFDSSVTNPSGLLLSPDDKLVVIFRNRKPEMSVMFEAFTWKEKWRQENSNIIPKAFSPDGQFLLICQKDSPTAAIVDANTGALVREISGHTGTVTAAAWSSANLIATGSDDKTIRISRPDGTLVRVLTGHKAAVAYLSFSNDGNQLFSNSSHFDGGMALRGIRLAAILSGARGNVFSKRHRWY